MINFENFAQLKVVDWNLKDTWNLGNNFWKQYNNIGHQFSNDENGNCWILGYK